MSKIEKIRFLFFPHFLCGKNPQDLFCPQLKIIIIRDEISILISIHRHKEKLSINIFSLFNCKLLFWKKLIRNININRIVVFIVLTWTLITVYTFLVCLSVCLIVSKIRKNGRTDRVKYLRSSRITCKICLFSNKSTNCHRLAQLGSVPFEHRQLNIFNYTDSPK